MQQQYPRTERKPQCPVHPIATRHIMDGHRRRLLPLALVLLAAVSSPSLRAGAAEDSTDISTPLQTLPWGPTFSSGSPYEANRDTVVRRLAGGGRFSNYSSGGDPPNNVNGVAMCYADSELADCQQCLDRAASYVFTECKYTSNVAIMFRDCILRYSSDDFFSNETDSGHVFDVLSTAFVGDVASWNQTRWTMMKQLVEDAAALPQRLATGNATYKQDGTAGTGTMYGLVQCRNDLSAEACKNCLKSQLVYALGIGPGNFNNNVNTYVSIRGFSCFIRQDVKPIAHRGPNEDPPSPPSPPTSSSSKARGRALIIDSAAGASVLLFLLILATGLFFYRRRQKRIAMVENPESNEMGDDQKLGEGGFGAVYRGFLQELSLSVAIKRVSSTSRPRRKEYASEVKIISRLRHRNLVKLIGWCHNQDELLLVYELMTNGSLDTHLYSAETVLSWRRRYEIILGIGSALLYLHQDCEQGVMVLHRDIKPSNVMLDNFFSAKLGDFGLARLVEHARGAYTTELAGTMGYMDPACWDSGRFSTQSDMYSFGIVLLEVACARQPIVVHQGKTFHLARRVSELYGRGAILDAADHRLNGDFDAGQMECVLVVGLWCTQHDPSLRPSIRQAISALRFEAPLPTTIVTKPPSSFVPDEDSTVAGGMNLRSTF